MGRMYAINLSPTAITVAADLVEISPPDDLPVLIHRFRVWPTTDTGDAAEELITLSWIRGYTASGSRGAAFTELRKNNRDAPPAFPCE